MKTSLKVLHWTPRVLGIMAIMFLSMFAMDSFSNDLTIWLQIRGFLIHLIPSFILLAFLVIAWKWEFVGGMIYALTGLGFIPFIYMGNFKNNNSVWTSIQIVLIINIPLVIVGILFLINHFKKRNQNS